MANTKFDVGEEALLKVKIIGIGITEDGINYTVNIDQDGDIYPGSTWEFSEAALRPLKED